MQIIGIHTVGGVILVRALLLAAAISTCVLNATVAAEEVIAPVQDAFVTGGKLAGDIMPDGVLQVAARSHSGMDYVRKTFLHFQMDEASLTHAESARVVLTLHGNEALFYGGGALLPVELVLSGAPGAEWGEKFPDVGKRAAS